MKTVIYYYRYDLSNPQDRADYEQLREHLERQGIECFASVSGRHYDWYKKSIKPLDGLEVELETEYLFSNQWNTAPTATSDSGLRVFDWAEAIYPNRDIREGQWLEQTPGMREIRRNTLKCGYCGKQEPAAKGYIFCPHCRDSEFLAESLLYLTRMQPIESDDPPPPLSPAEEGYLLPLYRVAQGLGKLSREQEAQSRNRQKVAALVPQAEAKAQQMLQEARLKTVAFTWLLDNGINMLDNVIYYSHSGKFCFGWREPLTQEQKQELESKLLPFPFDYTIKTKSNQTKPGGRKCT